MLIRGLVFRPFAVVLRYESRIMYYPYLILMSLTMLKCTFKTDNNYLFGDHVFSYLYQKTPKFKTLSAKVTKFYIGTIA